MSDDKQQITYSNKSNGINTMLALECDDGFSINSTSLMHHIHEIEKLVGYCGSFVLEMRDRGNVDE